MNLIKNHLFWYTFLHSQALLHLAYSLLARVLEKSYLLPENLNPRSGGSDKAQIQ